MYLSHTARRFKADCNSSLFYFIYLLVIRGDALCYIIIIIVKKAVSVLASFMNY